jgi:formylglycine-generating enzyme required for sulfatase activity
MKTLALIAALATLSLLVYSFSEKENKKRMEYLGQRVPPDMEFIPGNDSIPSFFMSKSEETNLNYLCYLNWLKRVYVDVPDIASDAEPHELSYSELTKFNDPILKGQLRNPAFAYYPVTGVDWLQVQDYLSWKTDRLNEDILIKLKYFKENPDQVNEDNFNYEAYMAGQYLGAVKKLVPGREDYYGEIKPYSSVYPFLFTGYRLPTEEEWEYAAGDKFRNSNFMGGGSYPYGKKYFLVNFLIAYRYGGEKYLEPYAENAGGYEPLHINRIKGGTSYDNRYYGVYNMGDNVKEWIMDIYTPGKRHYANMESVYSMNGFTLAVDSMYKNAEGAYREKDQSGRMPYRTMGVSANGNDFRVMNYRYQLYKDSVSRVPNPDSMKIRAEQKEKIKIVLNNMYWMQNFKATGDFYDKRPRYSDNGIWIEIKNYRVETGTENGQRVYKLVLDTNEILNQPKYIEERMYISTRYRYVPYKPGMAFRNRVVKSGTWKYPSVTARESMKETDASPDVGFRTVIPYMGIPIDKRNRVKWK